MPRTGWYSRRSQAWPPVAATQPMRSPARPRDSRRDARVSDRSAVRVNNEDMNGVLFFDGACGMCTRSVHFIKRFDRTGAVQIVPFQQPGSEERLGLDTARMYTSSWWLDATG